MCPRSFKSIEQAISSQHRRQGGLPAAIHGVTLRLRTSSAAGGGGVAAVLRAGRGAADGDQESREPQLRRLHRHRLQRRGRAAVQGQRLERPQPPRAPRRRPAAHPHHAREGKHTDATEIDRPSISAAMIQETGIQNTDVSLDLLFSVLYVDFFVKICPLIEKKSKFVLGAFSDAYEVEFLNKSNIT